MIGAPAPKPVVESKPEPVTETKAEEIIETLPDPTKIADMEPLADLEKMTTTAALIKLGPAKV